MERSREWRTWELRTVKGKGRRNAGYRSYGPNSAVRSANMNFGVGQ